MYPIKSFDLLRILNQLKKLSNEVLINSLIFYLLWRYFFYDDQCLKQWTRCSLMQVHAQSGAHDATTASLGQQVWENNRGREGERQSISAIKPPLNHRGLPIYCTQTCRHQNGSGKRGENYRERGGVRLMVQLHITM